MTLAQMLRLFLVVVICGNAGWVLAADEVLTLEKIPLVQYGYALLLSAWGGLAATLVRWGQGLENAKWWLVLVRDCVCSTLAGLLIFLLAKFINAPPTLSAVAVSVAGYGGSRVLEILLRRLEKKVEAAP